LGGAGASAGDPAGRVAALPNGCLYASQSVRRAVGGDRDQTAFLAASLGALALSSTVTYDSRQPLAAAGRFSDEQVFAADRTAMLWLARAGIPPLSAARAMDAWQQAGLERLPFAGGVNGPHLSLRRQQAQQAAAELIKAGSEFDFGVIDLVEHRYADALVRFQTFLEVLPQNDAAWNNLGLCHYRLSIAELPAPPYLLADAIAQFDTSWLKRSIREPDPEHWRAAKAAYEKALSIKPDRIEALSNFGNLYTVNRQYSEAKQMYERALAVDDGFAPALNNLGVVTVYLTDEPCPAAAQDLFERAASADAGLAEAQYNVGQARLERKAGDPRLPFDRYLALAPRGPKAREVTEYLRQQNAAPAAPIAPVVVPAAVTLHFGSGTGMTELESSARRRGEWSTPHRTRPSARSAMWTVVGWSHRGWWSN